MYSTVEQYRRCQRYLEKLLFFRDVGIPYDPEVVDRPPDNDEAIDAVYTFFQHCYHLKDWASKDPHSGLERAEVEAFVRASLPLCVCADLANGSKHFGLRQQDAPKSGYRQRIVGSNGEWRLGENFKLAKIIIGSGEDKVGPVFEAFELAETCMAEWDRLLSARMDDYLDLQAGAPAGPG